VNWILSKIKLNSMGEWLSQKRISDIVKRVFRKSAIDNNIIVISGSTYERKLTGIYNIAYVFDSDGSLCGFYKKYKLVPIEKAWGVKPGKSNQPILTSKGKLGLVICYDLDDPVFIKDMVANGAEVIIAPSGGWRPYPNYPFDKEKEQPQIERAIENNIIVVRPYCCGWLFPGLYFQGRTQIVGKKGEIIAESNDINKEQIFLVDV
jgi:predicted amidohydrolase